MITEKLFSEISYLKEKNEQLKQQLEKAEKLLSKYEIIHMDKPSLLDVHNDIKDYFLAKYRGENESK